MSNYKFIGGGFPGIKECSTNKIKESKESKEKREFSVNNIIPLSEFMKLNKPLNKIEEDLEIKNNIKYNDIDTFLHNSYTGKAKKIQNPIDNNMLEAISGDIPQYISKSESEYIKHKSNRIKSKKSNKSKKLNKSKKSNKSKKIIN